MIKLLTETQNRNFLRLWLAQLISQFGDRIHQMALVGLITERAGVSTSHLAKLMAFTIPPVLVIQPLAGVYIDRWDRKNTLFVCDMARGFLVLLIPFIFIRWEAILPVYVVVFLAFSFSRFYVPAKMSILPDIVREEQLISANSLVTTTGMIASVLGLGVGGLLIEKWGAKNGFIIDAVTFFLSGGMIFTIVVPPKIKLSKNAFLEKSKEFVKEIRTTFWQEFTEGLKYLFRQKEIRFIVKMFFVLLFAVGSLYVVSIVFIQEVFGSKTMHLGSVSVSLCLGLFMGVLLYGRWGRKEHWDKVIFSCLCAGGAVMAVFAIAVYHYPVIWIAMFLALLLGMIVGPIFIASYSMVHIICEEDMRGKTFSALEIVIHFAFLAAMLISSWVSELIPHVIVLTIIGIAVMIVGLMGMLKSRQNGFAWDGQRVA